MTQGAVVIGGAYGVGKAIAIALARNGYSVCVASRSNEALQQAVKALKPINPDACYSHVDVTNFDSVRALQQFAKNNFGNVKLVVSTAFGHIGEDEGKTLEDVSPAELKEFCEIGVLGSWYVLKAFADDLRSSDGRIIYVVADWGYAQHNVLTGENSANGKLGSEAFVSAKYAVTGLVTSADRMLGVSACGIYPGIIASKKSNSDSYYEIDTNAQEIEEDPVYANGWAISLADVASSVVFAASTRCVAKALLLRPRNNLYDGLHLGSGEASD
jgi:3-oxoacyl-[acyl-carrier protein] reductase